MRFEVLGPVRVHRDGAVVPVTGTLRRTLLAMLLAHANESVPVDALLEALWGTDSDPRRTQRLHLHVHKLRAVLEEPERISHGPGGYALRVEPGELDVHEFDRLVDEALRMTHREPQRCVEHLRRALGLVRGAPYETVDVLALAGEVQRCAERRFIAVEELYEAELRCGRHSAVVGELSELVREHPMRERLQGLLMTALYQGGRQAEALDVYRRARAVLVEELGLEPGPELREIEQQVLAGESMRLKEPVRSVPAQLPPAPAGFVGRDEELAQLDALVGQARDGVVIGSLTGPGGAGKTALAVAWAHRVRESFPDGQLYVDLRGYGPDEPAQADEVLAGLLRSLGVDGHAIPPSLDERSSLLRSVLSGSRTLLVLDNARTVGQLRPLLPASRECLALVTSRDPLTGLGAREGAHRISIDRLAEEAAHELLRAMLGAERVDDDPAAVDRLVLRCARLPLALRVAAERIRLRPDSTVQELVDELDDPEHRLDALEDGGDPHSSVRTILSWSYEQLSAATARTFRLWGLHPGGDIDEPALAALIGRDARATRRAVDALRRTHLVQRTGPRRFGRHDLLRAYAVELTHEVDGRGTRDDAFAKLCEHFLATAVCAMEWITPEEGEIPAGHEEAIAATVGFSSYEGARHWLDAELTNLMALADSAPDHGRPSFTTDLSTVLWLYLDIASHLDEPIQLHRLALDIAERRGDGRAVGFACRGLGVALFRQNEYERAAAYLERALEMHVGDAKAQAMTLNYLAGARQVVGHVDEAIDHLRRSIDLLREQDLVYPEMRPLHNLATLLCRRGQHAEAEECLNRARALAEETRNWGNTAYAMRDLARLALQTGRPNEALDHAQRARSIAAEHRLHRIEITVKDTLGAVHRHLGDPGTAVALHSEALVTVRTFRDDVQLARALNSLAESLLGAGRPQDAEQHHQEALALPAPPVTPTERARALVGLGDVHAAVDEHDRAVDHWGQAFEIYRDLDPHRAEELRARLGGP